MRDAAARHGAVLGVAEGLRAACGVDVAGIAPSGLPGPKGNLETFVWFAEAGRGGVAGDELEQLVAEAAA